MFKHPEELIMAALALLWVVLTYFLATYFEAPTQTALLITVLTLVWAAVFFGLWQRNKTNLIWPLFLGLLVACWWPFIDWLAIHSIITPEAAGETIVVNKPWYASWTFKGILSAIPTALGYLFKWKQHKKPLAV